MKLICSVLILAGVFALNSASAQIPIEMRISNDMSKIQDLMTIAGNRDASSTACSTNLLQALTAALTELNTDLDACNNSKETEIAALNEAAKTKLAALGASVDSVCGTLGQCASSESAVDSLGCYQSEGSQNSKLLSSVSTDAASAKVDLQRNIDNAQGAEQVCNQNASAKYSKKSDELDTEYKNCMSGRGSNTPAPAPATTTTPAPESDAPEGPAEEPENPGRRAVRPNRFNRF